MHEDKCHYHECIKAVALPFLSGIEESHENGGDIIWWEELTK